MGKALIIVESPAKIKTLKKFLGDRYSFESSVGHIRDLPSKDFGIDVDKDFDPKYVSLPDKKDVIKKLKDAAKKADLVYLSPDPDREGEAIAWHIAAILPKGTPVKRMVFYSITKGEVQDALKHPRDIDLSLVNAQQARRLLDRIVGYKISPILTRKVKGGKASSAGRVQSVALKLVVDREKEIEAFNPVEYWNIKTFLARESLKEAFEAAVHFIDGKKVGKEDKDKAIRIKNEAEAKDIVNRLQDASYTVANIEKKEKKRNPVPPFITSTLQQEAARHYGFNASRTMSIAQSLYEGIDMKKEGTEGLITYMRTDSVQLSKEALSSARHFIGNKFGKEFLPDKAIQYKSKKSAQEAHEAIRPTNLEHPPEVVKPYLNHDQFRLYILIWKRFIACQMKPAIYDTVTLDIDTDQKIQLRATGSHLKFKGFLAAYEEKNDGEHDETFRDKLLPDLKLNEKLILEDIQSTQSFTKPPPRFTEASLIKELEKSGIGRPSTYATIMNKIQSREYTTKENSALKPTELGKIIAQMLEENFQTIMNVGFTAEMEDQLEMIAENKKDWKELIKNFWKDFLPMVEKAEKEATVPKIMTDIDCPNCGKKLQKIWSRNKYFYGCSNYPECKFTTPIEALEFNKDDYDPEFDWDQPCPVCDAKMILRHGRYGAFLGCSRYPECNGIVNIPKKGEKTYKSEDLPSCPAKGCDGKITVRKSRFGKTFFSCSNFPDCDVIVNDLSDLPVKYADHPKTAYKKKAKKGKKAAKGKSTSKKATKKKATSTRTSPSYELSSELAKVVGSKMLSRKEVLKKIWDYIKSNQLQDPKDKRKIVPDKNLSKVFGTKKPVDMMKLAKILSEHMKKK